MPNRAIIIPDTAMKSIVIITAINSTIRPGGVPPDPIVNHLIIGECNGELSVESAGLLG